MTGVLALIALAIPRSVGLGLFLFVIPGILLALAPTAFIYTATFAIVRRFLPITHALALNLVAAFITLGLGVLAASPMALAGRWAFNQAATGDVIPPSPVVISGDVLLINDETQVANIAGKREVLCAALCAALLDTPGVRTVTIAHKEVPASYRLVPKAEAGRNARTPKGPEEILRYLPEKPIVERDYQAIVAARKARENAVTARWGLRLANDITLSIVPPPAHHDLTIALTLTGPYGYHEVAVKQLELRDRQGRVLLRRQYVTAQPVFVPLLLFPYDIFGSSTWALARNWITTGGRLAGISAIRALFDETTLARPSEPGEAVTGMVAGIRDRLAAALMQPGAPADLALADPWLKTINWPSINDGDLELLGKLIADTRVTYLPRLYENAVRSVRAELRNVVVARLVNPVTLPQFRTRLDELVRYMPPGTFAVSTPDELTLLRNPLLRMSAPALVERLADQGQAGVPELLRILQEDMRVEPPTMREDLLKAVRRALIRLGPDAASALPVLIELFDHTALTRRSSAADEWRIAMVLMGRPVEEVPFSPELTVERVAQLRSDLMRNAKWARDHPDGHH